MIIGGGPAGLAAALGLARHKHKIVVFDNNHYRNDATHHMHNVLTWDHKSPADFRSAARANLERYKTIHFKSKTITNVKPGFEATDSDGTVYTARKLVLAYGRSDIYPDIRGYDKCWGQSVFHCLFCHGYEDQGPSAGILAVGMLEDPQILLHTARMASLLVEKVTIYTHGNEEVSESLRSTFKHKPLQIDERTIIKLEQTDGVKIHLATAAVKESFLVHMPSTTFKTDLHTQLGLEMVDQFGQSCIKVSEPFKETSVPGCFAVGDLATPIAAVPVATQSGGACAAGISPQIAQLDYF